MFSNPCLPTICFSVLTKLSRKRQQSGATIDQNTIPSNQGTGEGHLAGDGACTLQTARIIRGGKEIGNREKRPCSVDVVGGGYSMSLPLVPAPRGAEWFQQPWRGISPPLQADILETDGNSGRRGLPLWSGGGNTGARTYIEGKETRPQVARQRCGRSSSPPPAEQEQPRQHTSSTSSGQQVGGGWAG